MNHTSTLEKQADDILAKAGCRRDGRKIGSVKGKDVMSVAIRCGFRGKSRRR